MLDNNDNNAMVILWFWNDFKMISFLRKKNKIEKGKSSEKMPGPIFNIWPLKLIIE